MQKLRPISELRDLLDKKKSSKYRNNITEADGIKFHSKKEAKYYLQLKNEQNCGVVKWFIRQPMFDLPGGTKYRADFLVVYSNNRIQIVDVKGHRLKEFIRAKKQVEALYPITIEER